MSSYNFAPGHRETIALLANDGSFFVGPQNCRSYIVDALCSLTYPGYAEIWSIWNPIYGDKKPGKSPNLDSPEFVLWTGLKSVENNAKKLSGFLGELEGRIGLEPLSEVIVPNTGQSKTSAPIVIRANRFWIKSPVATSALLTFIKLTPRMRRGERFDDFMARMFDKKLSPYQDAAYLRAANKRGNIRGLLDRSLPAFNREGFSDYLMHSHSRTFSWYHPESDNLYPKDESNLNILRIDGRLDELSRMHEMDQAAAE